MEKFKSEKFSTPFIRECSACYKLVDTRAVKCPHCGMYMRHYKALYFVGCMLLVTFLILLSIYLIDQVLPQKLFNLTI